MTLLALAAVVFGVIYYAVVRTGRKAQARGAAALAKRTMAVRNMSAREVRDAAASVLRVSALHSETSPTRDYPGRHLITPELAEILDLFDEIRLPHSSVSLGRRYLGHVSGAPGHITIGRDCEGTEVESTICVAPNGTVYQIEADGSRAETEFPSIHEFLAMYSDKGTAV